MRVCSEERRQVHKRGAGRRVFLRAHEGAEDGGEEGDGLHEPGARVGRGEEGIEDGGEVEGVERRGAGGGDHGARVRQAPRVVC